MNIFLDAESIYQYITAIVEEPLFSSFFFCILSVILSAIFSILWYFITLKKIRLSWCIDVKTCIDTSFASPNSLMLLYEGTKVERLAVYNFCFWNSGTEAIRDSDVMQQLEITIPENYSIFYAEKLAENYEPNNIIIQDCRDRKSVIFTFKYLEPKQGFECCLVSDCINSNEISMKGKILGCKELQNEKIVNPYKKYRKYQKVLRCLIGVLVSYALYDISLHIYNSAIYSKIQSNFDILSIFIETVLMWVRILSLLGFSIVLDVIIISFLKNKNKPHFL